MLQNSFYKAAVSHQAGVITATVTFDKDHVIFSGHFPGNPVVPGVCMIQIVRELVEQCLQEKMKILSGDNIKFLSVINPITVPQVQVQIQWTDKGGKIDIQASFFLEQMSYFKFKGTFGR